MRWKICFQVRGCSRHSALYRQKLFYQCPCFCTPVRLTPGPANLVYYKLAVLTHKIRATSTPSYLSDHIRPHETTRHLRSSTMPLLHRPTTRTHFADRAFRCCTPSVWNSLDSETLHCSSISGFKRRLKTLLFRQIFSSTTWTVRQRLWSHPTSWRYINKIIIIIIILLSWLADDTSVSFYASIYWCIDYTRLKWMHYIMVSYGQRSISLWNNINAWKVLDGFSLWPKGQWSSLQWNNICFKQRFMDDGMHYSTLDWDGGVVYWLAVSLFCLVNWHWACLPLGRVTVCGQVICLDMWPAT